MSNPAGDRFSVWYGDDKLINSALVGIGLLITQAFISLGTLDIPATVSIFAFSLATPMLAFNVLVRNLLFRKKKNPGTRATIFLWGVGVIASAIGIDAAFWHVSWIAGVLLLTSGAIGLGIYIYYLRFPIDKDD
jgi:hypothetical protein